MTKKTLFKGEDPLQYLDDVFKKLGPPSLNDFPYSNPTIQQYLYSKSTLPIPDGGLLGLQPGKERTERFDELSFNLFRVRFPFFFFFFSVFLI